MSDLAAKLKGLKPHLEAVEVKEWSSTVYLKDLSLGERKQFLSVAPEQQLNKLLFLTICDDQGNRLFDSPEALDELSGQILERLSKDAIKVNGFGATEKDLDDIEKN